VAAILSSCTDGRNVYVEGLKESRDSKP